MVESKDPELIFLTDRQSNTPIPLLTILFDVNISFNFADIVIHQVYENTNYEPIDTIFLMPNSDAFYLNKIMMDFTLEDGTVKSLET
jgi:hypothetical protein